MMGTPAIAEWTNRAGDRQELPVPRELDQRRVADQLEVARFEQAVLPHLAAAYNLARWLTRNDHDAEDVVQESYLRAWKFFGSFHGEESRPWLLTIVRHTCYTWLQQH